MALTLRLASAFAVSTLSSLVQGQDFIHYKFDSPCTTEVINYATGPSALPGNGVLETTSTISPWQGGMFGGALAGGAAVAPTFYNRVRTGWDPSTQPVTGSLTIAWFLRKRNAPGTALGYLMGAPSGGFRMFTNGVAGRGLYQRIILAGGGNGVNATIANDFYLPATAADVQTLAAAGWVHIAMVIDAVAQTATWYVNGAQALQLTGVPGALINAAGPFQVGYYSSPSPYDTDEFLMSFRAYTPAEILALSLLPQAGDGDYLSNTAAQCGTLGLGSFCGRPSIGNAGYGLSINTAATGLWVLLFGFDRCTFGGAIPLPFDGGLLSPIAAGCQVLTDIATTASGLAVGNANVPLVIPPVSAFAGLNIYSQAGLIDFATNAVSASNGLAISIGI
jgi:hypothetical protein